MMNKASTKSGAIKDSGYDPASFGQAGFGFEDVKELSRQGYGKDQISNLCGISQRSREGCSLSISICKR